MTASESRRALRRTAAFTVIIFCFSVTILLALLALMSLVYGDPVRLHFDRFGERWIELAVFAVVIGAMPFVLLVIDEGLRTS